MNEKVFKRASLILEIASRQAACHSDHSVSNHVEEIQLHTQGYAEKGMQDFSSQRKVIVATGNWNDVDVYNPHTRERMSVSILPSRIKKLFERLGIECEWSDMWSTCDDCAKLFQTVGDCYFWEPSFVVNLRDGSKKCLECSKPKE